MLHSAIYSTCAFPPAIVLVSDEGDSKVLWSKHIKHWHEGWHKADKEHPGPRPQHHLSMSLLIESSGLFCHNAHQDIWCCSERRIINDKPAISCWTYHMFCLLFSMSYPTSANYFFPWVKLCIFQPWPRVRVKTEVSAMALPPVTEYWWEPSLMVPGKWSCSEANHHHRLFLRATFAHGRDAQTASSLMQTRKKITQAINKTI